MGNVRTCVVSIALLAACGDDELVGAPPDAATAVSEEVGEDGGTVELGDDVTVEIPPGAVDGDTTITIEVSDDPPPADALGPVYAFGPDGLVFAHPITITFALPDGASDADVYWSSSGSAFANVGGDVASGSVSTQVVHFSEGYAGEPSNARTVTGSQVVTWVSASGFQNIPNDLSSFPVAALVEDGSGGYTTIDGDGNADGTFEIVGVPDGPYWLRVPGRDGGVAFARTDANAIDAGYTAQGRPDAVAVTGTTDLVLNLTNLATWSDGDQLEVFSSEAFAWYFNAEIFATSGSPAVDDTALTDFTLDTANACCGTPHLIDGTRTPPDRLVVAQLAQQMAGSVPYLAMSRVFEPPAFSTTSGVATTLTGAFTDVSIANTLTLDVRMDAIRAALEEETRPCTRPQGWTTSFPTYVLGVAGGLDHGLYGNTADFLVLFLDPAAPDTVAEGMGYGVPLQGEWGVYAGAMFGHPCEYTLPGLAPGFGRTNHGLMIQESIAQIGGGPLAPRLGQVRGPTIDGADLFAEQTGFGLTPTIAWTAPSVGTPAYYEVAIERLFDDAGTTKVERVALLITPQTSLTLPPGVLAAGEAYAIAIAARVSSRSDPSAFHREVLPEYTSTVMSAIQRP